MASNEKYENETTSIWYDHPQLHVVLHLVENFIAFVPHIFDNETTRGQGQGEAGLKWR